MNLKQIDDLISEANGLKEVPYDSPKVSLWERRAKNYVKSNFGEDYLEIFEQALDWGSVIVSGEGARMHFEAMTRGIEFLESLKAEIPSVESEGEDTNSLPDYPIHKLHPFIYKKCKSLFVGGSYSEAVEKAFKVVRDRLRTLTGHETGSEAFGKGHLHIKGAAAPHVDFDFNEGCKFLTMAIDKFRNEKSHTADGNIDNPQRAYEYLSLASLALNLLEDSEII